MLIFRTESNIHRHSAGHWQIALWRFWVIALQAPSLVRCPIRSWPVNTSWYFWYSRLPWSENIRETYLCCSAANSQWYGKNWSRVSLRRMNLKTSSVVYRTIFLLSHGEKGAGWQKPRRGKYDTVDSLQKKVDLRDILTTFLQMIRNASFQFANKCLRRNAFV